jgi:NMD protein affecting ribosome stability and mRNA decay
MKKEWVNPGGDEVITVRVCNSCGWSLRHPIRWCSNCGGELVVTQMTERAYLEKIYNFHLRTGWTWSDAKYDYNTGKRLKTRGSSK